MSVSRRDQARNFVLGVIIYSILEKLWWLANLPARLIIRQFRLRFLEGFLGTTALTLFLFAAVTSIWSAGANAVDAGKRAFEQMFGGGEQRPAASAPVEPAPSAQAAQADGPAESLAEPAAPAPEYVYLADFIRSPEGSRYAISNLTSDAALAARFEEATAVQSAATVLKTEIGDLLFFRGCQRHRCPMTYGFLAIDQATGEAFAGIVEDGDATVVVPNPRIEAALDAASGAESWASVTAHFG